MKKWMSFVMIFAFAFLLIACKPKDEEVLSTIEITGEKHDIIVGEKITLTATVKPTQLEVTWTTKNNLVATVENGVVEGIGEGNTEIVVSLKSNTKVIKTYTINVTKPIEYADPESVELTGRRAEVAKGSFINLDVKVNPQNALQEVLFTSSDETIATVDATGKVKGIAVGTVIITAKTVNNPDIFDTYQVTVIEYEIPEDLNPTDIIITGENSVYEGREIILTAQVLPTGTSQNVVWSSTDDSIATVSSQGLVTGLKPGSVFIQASSAKDMLIFEVIKITVKIAPEKEPYPDLNGYQIKIMGSSGHSYEHNPFDDLYKSEDKQAKQAAWLEIERLFNCDITVVDYPTEAPWGPARVNWLIEKASLNKSEADIVVSTTDWLKSLVDGNAIVDVSEFYDLYGQNQMPAALKQATSYKGGLYSLATPNVGGLNVDKGMYYNVALIESLHLESPAKLFNEGRWTYSGFSDWVKNADGVLGENQYVLSGKPVLYWIGMTNAAGVKLIDTVTLEVNFSNSIAKQAASVLRDLYQTTGWGTMGWDANVTSFNEGNSIFQAAEYWFIRSSDRWPDTLWDQSGHSRFGYVPFPYPDTMDKENTRTVGGDGQCYMMPSGIQYPVGVEAKHIYRAFADLMIKTGEIMKSDPEFDEVTIMKRAAEISLDDPESVNALVFFKRDKVLFDPVYGMIAYATYLSPGLERVVRDGEDYSQVLDSYYDTYYDRLMELYS